MRSHPLANRALQPSFLAPYKVAALAVFHACSLGGSMPWPRCDLAVPSTRHKKAGCALAVDVAGELGVAAALTIGAVAAGGAAAGAQAAGAQAASMAVVKETKRCMGLR